MKRSLATIEVAGGTWQGLECGHPNPTEDSEADVVECGACDRRQIPPTTKTGRQTPVFEATTTPPALLGAHQTNAWAELVVVDGHVEFFDEQPGWHDTATPGHRVVIVPKREHRIEPSHDARFYVQFYDLPRTLTQVRQTPRNS